MAAWFVTSHASTMPVCVILERQAEYGHTVYPQANLVIDINELPLEPYCAATGDILNSLADFFSPVIVQDKMKNGDTAYQLVRL
jgi:hypothetical protein